LVSFVICVFEAPFKLHRLNDIAAGTIQPGNLSRAALDRPNPLRPRALHKCDGPCDRVDIRQVMSMEREVRVSGKIRN